VLAKEQEQYYAKLKTAFPSWSQDLLSGWVHGAVDEDMNRAPKRDMVTRAKHNEVYACGYLLSFALHRGIDAEEEHWFEYVPRLETLK
jgi:hypothetical protein